MGATIGVALFALQGIYLTDGASQAHRQQYPIVFVFTHFSVISLDHEIYRRRKRTIFSHKAFFGYT